jgi:ElaB/YqjD/DUF883 family membrane-anchored ribosome-binding protein
MANMGDQGGTNPSQATHPRMSAGLPQGAGMSTAERGRESDITSRVGDAFESAREGITEGAQYVAEQTRTLWTDTARLVRRYPMEALGITLGVGCLLGCCLSAYFGSSGGDMTRRMSRSSV